MSVSVAFAKVALIAVFLGSFVVAVTVIASAYARGTIYSSDLQELILHVLAVYSIPLGTILGGVFAQSGDRERGAPRYAFVLAVTVGVLWNVLLLARIVIFGVATQDSVTELERYIDTVSSASSFLVVGALAFFFAKQESGVNVA